MTLLLTGTFIDVFSKVVTSEVFISIAVASLITCPILVSEAGVPEWSPVSLPVRLPACQAA